MASIEEYDQAKNFSLDSLLVNSLGTRQLLEIAKENKAKFILFSAADLYSGAISTSSLRYYFGKSPEGESVLSFHEAKRFAEALAFEYFKKFGLNVTIIRLKDVYGPRMNLESRGEIVDLLKSALQREPLRVYGDGLKIINPTFVSDVIFASVKATLGDFNGEIFNLVNPEKTTIESFAQTLKLVAGPLEIERKKDKNLFELPESHFDLNNTREKLSWNPKVSLAEGISSLIQSSRIEELGVQEPQKKLDEIKVEEKLEEKKPFETKKEPRKLRAGLILRIIIFATSFFLLIFTIVYPTLAVSFGTLRGEENIKQALKNLEESNTQLAIRKAAAAQDAFEMAEKNLQNLSWLLKMVGLGDRSANFDRLLAAEISFSDSVRQTSRATAVLIDTAEKPDLDSTEARKKLEESLNHLYQSQTKLEETQVLLGRVEWSKNPKLIAPEQVVVLNQVQELQNQVQILIEQIEQSLERS